MFGYVRVDRNELRVREDVYYRATYCGLCRAMGKCTGQCSRLALSYDFAFLAQVRMALLDTRPTFAKKRCMVHPVRRRTVMCDNEVLSYCALAAAILNFEKCRDDLADERGLGRLRARFRCLFLRGAYRRAKKRLPLLCDTVREKLEALGRLEKQARASVDEPAAIFGELLAEITAHGLTGDAAVLARSIGRLVGRFIYIVDAADDYEKDLKSGAYNPFRLLYREGFDEQARHGTQVAVVALLCDLAGAFDLLCESENTRERDGVLKNVLYFGMPATLKKVLYGAPPEEEKEWQKVHTRS